MTNISKTLVFFGNEKLATGVVNVQSVILRAIEAAGFTIEQNLTGPLSDLRPHQAQLAVLVAYGHVIPQHVLDEFPLGVINVHPSLLPTYRGSTPIEQTILDGSTEAGVSIMKLVSGMDEGPIYGQQSLELSGHESKQELTETLQQLGAVLLTNLLTSIADGSLIPKVQLGEVSYTKRLEKADGTIDSAKPATQLEREVRAYQGWPKSRTEIAGNSVIITKAHVSTDSKTPLDILCGDGVYLSIDEIIAPSGRTMNASAFLNGYAAG